MSAGSSLTGCLPDDVRSLFIRVVGSFWDGEKTVVGERDVSASLDDELNLLRLLLLRLKSADESVRRIIAHNLTALIVRDDGLRKLLQATFDFDESSQRETTQDQRILAIANVVVFAPRICCPVLQYFSSLSQQIFSLMDPNDESQTVAHVSVLIRKICVAILNGMFTRNRQLTVDTFITPMISSVSMSRSDLRPQHCIAVLYGLCTGDFDRNLIAAAFPVLFFALCSLHTVSCQTTTQLRHVVTDCLQRIENSIYLLDDALFNRMKECANMFQMSSGSLVFTENRSETLSAEDANRIAILVSDLTTEAFSEQQLVDFCLILLQRMSFHNLMLPDAAFLLYTLVALILAKVEPLLCKYPRKWIQFAIETLNRLTSESERSAAEAENRNDNQSSLQIDTADIILQIIRTITSDSSKLLQSDVQMLRNCIDTMCQSENPVIQREELISLSEELKRLEVNGPTVSTLNDSSEDFDTALKHLNDPLMPTRAHGLIVLKRLIESDDPKTVSNYKRLLRPLEISLSDSESYIYLSAINTLSSLSLKNPEESIPMLLRAFDDENRTLQERLNVGEVLSRLTRRLGDQCITYSPMFFDKFITCLEKNEDEIMRVSCLSNMAFLCSQLGPELDHCMGRIFGLVQSLISSDQSMLVKRACLMLLHQTLSSVTGEDFESFLPVGNRIHRLVSAFYANSSDDACRLHAQLALEELDRIVAKQLSVTGHQQLRTGQ